MITLAKDGMRTDLEYIWRACFNDSSAYVRYFFDNRYNPNNCAVYIDPYTGRPVAMLNMLSCTINEDGALIPAQYIYAAATRPDHQGKGIMTRLIEYARRCAAARGQAYMVLVPGSKELYKFYEKQGFYTCFHVRNVCMTSSELRVLSDKYADSTPSARRSALSVADISAVRRDVLVDREGYIAWDMPAIRYAAGAHIVAGGSVIADAVENEAGYAFCDEENSSVRISEFVCHNGMEPTLINDILAAYPNAHSFDIRLPVFDEFFSEFGQIEPFGMIRAVNGRKPVNLLTLSDRRLPYIGLPLD